MFIYYVYAYLREFDTDTAKKGTPYYIGKGKDRRAFEKHGTLRLPPKKENIIFLEQKLSEIGALALERRLIEWYGRKDLNTGILHNRTEGGEGNSPSIITRKKISKTLTGRKLPKEQCDEMSIRNLGEKNPFYGKKHSEETLKIIRDKRANQIMKPCAEETKQKIRDAQIGVPRGPMSQKEKDKRSKANKGRPKPVVICPHCNKSGGVSVMSRWHFDNCKHK